MGKRQTHSRHHKREVSPFPAGDHKAHTNRRTQRHSKHKTEQKHKRSTKKVSPKWILFWSVLRWWLCLQIHCLLLLLFFMGVLCFVFVMQYFVYFLVLRSSRCRRERADCFTLFVILLSCGL